MKTPVEIVGERLQKCRDAGGDIGAIDILAALEAECWRIVPFKTGDEFRREVTLAALLRECANVIDHLAEPLCPTDSDHQEAEELIARIGKAVNGEASQ